MLPDILLEAGREALAHHHRSPVPLRITGGAIREQTRPLCFEQPDPRTKATLQRERVVEDGAIVMAGAVLSLEGLRLRRVTRRGSRVDYFVASSDGTQHRGVIEIGGTDRRSIGVLCREKLHQVRRSYFVRPPFGWPGWVAVTRFVEPQCRLERVDPEERP